jgi:Protein of unknown function (DUF4232)
MPGLAIRYRSAGALLAGLAALALAGCTSTLSHGASSAADQVHQVPAARASVPLSSVEPLSPGAFGHAGTGEDSSQTPADSLSPGGSSGAEGSASPGSPGDSASPGSPGAAASPADSAGPQESLSAGPPDSPGAGPSATPSPGTTGSTGAGVTSCRTSQLRAELKFGSVSADAVHSTLELKNTATSACMIKGWPTFRLENSSGGSLPGNTVEKDHPAGPADVTLEPGATTYAGTEWRAADGCEQAGAINVTPPGEASPIIAHLTGYGSATEMAQRLRVCDGTVTTGTLQSRSTGSQF